MNGIATASRTVYQIAFEKTPIILTGGGLAFPLPIVALIGQAAATVQGAVLNGNGFSLNDFYADYLPITGNTVINNAIATYPFANQQVAANAIIQQPTNVSLRMIAPVRNTGGYLTKLAIFTALQSSLQGHNNAGGTYDVLTPSFIYFDCVLTGMSDITPEEDKQKQTTWQLDFIKPLISTADANAAFSTQMGKIAGGSVINSNLPTGL